jgi:hypothetical protein
MEMETHVGLARALANPKRRKELVIISIYLGCSDDAWQLLNIITYSKLSQY